jgi:hypothetical protein
VTGSSDSHGAQVEVQDEVGDVFLDPGITSNSCGALVPNTWLTAAPGIDEAASAKAVAQGVAGRARAAKRGVWTFPSRVAADFGTG